MIEGLVDGTIDCIASDHAPHSVESKDAEFDQAPAGMIGLETTVGLVKRYLIDKGYLTWADAIRKMTINPARILKLPGGKLQEGSLADITIINPEKRWKVKAEDFRSFAVHRLPVDGSCRKDNSGGTGGVLALMLFPDNWIASAFRLMARQALGALLCK